MMRTLLWKEYREQRTTAIALIAFAVTLVVIVQAFGEPQPIDSPAIPGLLMCLAWMTGLIVGAQPLAGESENQTLSWLDAQPVRRRPIYEVKAATATLIVLLDAAILLALAAGMRWIPAKDIGELALGLLICAVSGLGCGLFGSAFAGTAMAAIGWALLAQWTLSIVWFFAYLLIGGNTPVMDPSRMAIAALIVLPLPFVTAARRFTRLDRSRRVVKPQGRSGRPRDGWKPIFWLAWRQSRIVVGTVVLVGLATAILLPIERLDVPPYWPAIGLALGIVAGLGVFAADRPGEARRFLGNQRVPLNRIWLVKTGLRLGALGIAVLLQMLRVWARAQEARFNLNIGPNNAAPWSPAVALQPAHLILTPLYGFALAQFLGMVSRKGAVALILSCIFSVGVLVIWWPAIYAGGLHVWQWLVQPLLLLVATRGAMWPWATGRLGTSRPASALVGTFILAGFLAVAGLWFHVTEASVQHDQFDVAAFERTFPTPEENKAGRSLAHALSEVPERIFAAGPFVRASDALRNDRWPLNDNELDAALDSYASQPWFAETRDAVRLPLGVIAVGPQPFPPVYSSAQTASLLLKARTLQQIAHGQLAEALELLADHLSLSRQVRNKANTFGFQSAAFIEQVALGTWPAWIAAASKQPDLLKKSIDVMLAHDRTIPPVSDTIKREYLRAISSEQDLHSVGPETANESELARLLRSAPWEQWRRRTILATLYAGYLRTAEMPFYEAMPRIEAAHQASGLGDPALVDWTPAEADANAAAREVRRLFRLTNSPTWTPITAGQSGMFTLAMVGEVRRRAAVLQAALSLYHVRHDRPATRLTELVPEMLAESPIDPYSGDSFHYRVSAGEELPRSGNVQQALQIAAGQGVVWSVGPDMRDDGGLKPGAAYWRSMNDASDLIFLVPLVK